MSVGTAQSLRLVTLFSILLYKSLNSATCFMELTFGKVAKTFMHDEIKICGLLKRSFRRSIARS